MELLFFGRPGSSPFLLTDNEHPSPAGKRLSESRHFSREVSVTDRSNAGHSLASYPGIPIWRRGEEECLVHTAVRMCLISNQLLCKKRKMTNSRGLGFIDDVCQRRSEYSTCVHTRPSTSFRCLLNTTMVSNNQARLISMRKGKAC